ncbi:MAG: tRNA (adenosine(37)-N6)-dimethylallyltransferase MiaA [Campylobacterales bacterium]
MKTVAIIGPTASGKTDIAHALARKTGAAVLSCDSLSVFQTIDIASAKPSPKERAGIDYFGIDCVAPCGRFGADEFIEVFKEAKRFCQEKKRPLIIAGGTGFYLKMLTNGLSAIPPIAPDVAAEVDRLLENPVLAHQKLLQIDPVYGSRIDPNDRYRIEKGLLIALAGEETPTGWFAKNPPKPLLESVAVFEVSWPTEALRGRIAQRTRHMLDAGLIDEVARLEACCPRNAQAMRSIGIAEVLDYFDGKTGRKSLETLISTHTAQLAKRQRTFNRGQFDTLVSLGGAEILDRAQPLLF